LSILGGAGQSVPKKKGGGMMKIGRILAVMAIVCMIIPINCISAGGNVPKALKSRFIVSDPVWKELPVRDNLKGSYDKVWQTVVNSILENNFDIATMDRESGYVRTSWNEGVISLGGNWYYKVQISAKFVYDENASGGKTIQKVRVQVAGELTKSAPRGGISEYMKGYDTVILQNLMQDLQAKLGTV
jgi:hypothetical protein